MVRFYRYIYPPKLANYSYVMLYLPCYLVTDLTFGGSTLHQSLLMTYHLPIYDASRGRGCYHIGRTFTAIDHG